MQGPLLYTLIALLIAPWLLFWAGAFVRWRAHGRRLRRMQLEGATLVLIALVSRWLVFDANFGFDRYGTERWSYWYSRGELGLFWIGLLVFLLGFLLTRRPHLKPPPWPLPARMATWLGLLAGTALGIIAARGVTLPASELPWSVARALFLLGCWPFAIAYFSFRREPPPRLVDATE